MYYDGDVDLLIWKSQKWSSDLNLQDRIYVSWPSTKVKPIQISVEAGGRISTDLNRSVMGRRHSCILFCVVLDLPGKE